MDQTEEIRIEPLSYVTLPQAGVIADRTFPHEEYVPSFILLLSREPEKHAGDWEEHQLIDLKYWVALVGNRVVGITGYYWQRPDGDDAFWLSWFCVDPSFRRRGIGTTLLELIENEARKHGKKFLRLYTSTHPSEANAQILYDKRGYRFTHSKQLPNELRVYREKSLD
jgi:GNAT superfamily N-acetyltransferase